MQVTCPQLTTCWLMMGNVCKWLLAKRIVLFEYIDVAEDPVNSAPPNWWWIIITGISALTDLINPVFIKLQAPNLLLSTQLALLDMLSTDYRDLYNDRNLRSFVSCRDGQHRFGLGSVRSNVQDRQFWRWSRTGPTQE